MGGGTTLQVAAEAGRKINGNYLGKPNDSCERYFTELSFFDF
jgi:hypothetical protein